MTAGWGVRTVRAAVFAAVCVLLAALGHVMMSGTSVPWWVLGAAGVATAGAGWCLAGRERGLPLIVTVVVATQTALHSAFSLARPTLRARTPDMGSMSGHGMPMSSPEHHMGATHMGSAHMGATPMDGTHMDGTHLDSLSMGSTDAMDMPHMGAGYLGHLGHDTDGTASLGMLAAHLLAALLCGLWLAYGERAAFRILRTVAGRLAAPLRLLLALPTPPHCPRLRVRRGSSDRSPLRLLLVHAITSRGPPTRPAVV